MRKRTWSNKFHAWNSEIKIKLATFYFILAEEILTFHTPCMIPSCVTFIASPFASNWGMLAGMAKNILFSSLVQYSHLMQYASFSVMKVYIHELSQQTHLPRMLKLFPIYTTQNEWGWTWSICQSKQNTNRSPYTVVLPYPPSSTSFSSSIIGRRPVSRWK